MSQESVIFKGSKSGIVVILDEQKPFEDIINDIRYKLEHAENFFCGTDLNIGFQGRSLDAEERQQLSKTITEIVGTDVHLDFESRFDQLLQRIEVFDGIDEGITKFHRGTVRAGQCINAEGNLVIMGDVNPSAQVVANGNIIVMGSARGIVHAGHNGNRRAIVAALNLQPTQLRIADVISRSPDEDDKHRMMPEIAYVKEDKIYIEAYLSKKRI